MNAESSQWDAYHEKARSMGHPKTTNGSGAESLVDPPNPTSSDSSSDSSVAPDPGTASASIAATASEPSKLDLLLDGVRRHGLKVFRLAENQKVPEKGSSGHKDATDDEATIRRLVDESPNSNFAFVPGLRPAGGHSVVLDLDKRDKTGGTKNGIVYLQQWCEKHGVDFPSLITKGFVVETPNGFHIYLHSWVPIKQGANLLGKPGEKTGVDSRTAKGYVLAPGSVINGRAYRVICHDEMLQAPEALVVAIGRETPPTEWPFIKRCPAPM